MLYLNGSVWAPWLAMKFEVESGTLTPIIVALDYDVDIYWRIDRPQNISVVLDFLGAVSSGELAPNRSSYWSYFKVPMRTVSSFFTTQFPQRRLCFQVSFADSHDFQDVLW